MNRKNNGKTDRKTDRILDRKTDGKYPSYSVLLSVYHKDHPQFLKESVMSMVRQTVPPDEIVLVEDGALTRELYQMISHLSRQIDRLKIIPLAENRGLGQALNCGIKHCTNELIARMDADDISLSHRCEMQLKCFLKHPELSIVGAQIDEFIGDPSHVVSTRRVPETFSGIAVFARRRSPFNHVTVMYKKSAVLKYGGYPGHYRRKEDLALFLRMVFDGCDSENLPEGLVRVRVGEDNLKRRTSWINCREYISVMYRFFREKKIGPADLAYVVLGQLVLYAAPAGLAERLSQKFLRS